MDRSYRGAEMIRSMSTRVRAREQACTLALASVIFTRLRFLVLCAVPFLVLVADFGNAPRDRSGLLFSHQRLR